MEGHIWSELYTMITNQGTRIESRWRRKEIDGAGVKTSLTLYSLLWQSRHFQRTHATLHPAWRGSYCPVLSGGDVLVLNCWHIADTPIWEVTGSAHAEKCYSALCMETPAVSVELLVTQAWVGGIVFNSLRLSQRRTKVPGSSPDDGVKK